jgi:hypothetical protein
MHPTRASWLAEEVAVLAMWVALRTSSAMAHPLLSLDAVQNKQPEERLMNRQQTARPAKALALKTALRAGEEPKQELTNPLKKFSDTAGSITQNFK